MASTGGSNSGGGGGNGGGKSMPPSLGLIKSPSTPLTSGSAGFGGGMAGHQQQQQQQPPGSLARSPTSEVLDSLDYMFGNLSVVVVGASGDLAKKKVRACVTACVTACLPACVRAKEEEGDSTATKASMQSPPLNRLVTFLYLSLIHI